MLVASHHLLQAPRTPGHTPLGEQPHMEDGKNRGSVGWVVGWVRQYKNSERGGRKTRQRLKGGIKGLQDVCFL